MASDMTDAEKLEALVRKAVFDGWKPTGYWLNVFDNYEYNEPLHKWVMPAGGDTAHIYAVLFNHDFARALFGESSDTLIVQNNSINVKQVVDMNGWRYHLQQAVISDDPIDYMYGVVFGD